MNAIVHAGEQAETRIGELEQELEALKADRAHASKYWTQLGAIIDSAPLAIYMKDAAHTYVMVNREYERLSARKREDILGRQDFELFPPAVAQLFREQDQEVTARGVPVEFKETIPLPDGVHSFITSKFPLNSAAGELLGVAGVCTEITALERAQQTLEQTQSRLVEQERLAALGELSAVIAHEVRNPLGVIFNSLAAFKRLLVPAPQGQQLLDIIKEEAERLDRMVIALLELARPTPLKLALSPIEPLTADAIEAARALANSSDKPRLEIPVPVPAALIDEKMLHQALTHLISNAIQAPRRRSPVTVRVEVEGEGLRFEVIDDGLGVPPELTERIFAPFFTTRATGTGVGLAQVRHIAEAHRGTVAVQPTPGGGATFVLRIPLAAGAPAPAWR